MDNFVFSLDSFSMTTHETLKANILYFFYYNIFKTIALNMFKWENLPDTMDADYLEKTLYRDGKACVINNDNYGYINTLVRGDGNLNMYEYSNRYTSYSVVGEYGTYDIDDPDFYLIKNNISMMPTRNIISLYAYKLFKTDCAIETNIDLQKYSALFLCDEKERLTITNIISKWKNNIPLIIGDKSLDIEQKLKVLDFKIPYIADKLYNHKDKLMSELLSFLGINNVQTEKKERLISDEVNANNELIQGNMFLWLDSRKEFVKTFNERTGMNISVSVNTEKINSLVRGFENNVKIHSDTSSANGE